jgi:hypothetical protein
MWHVGPLLGNDREISNCTTANAKLRLREQAYLHGNKRIQQYGRVVFYAVSAEML